MAEVDLHLAEEIANYYDDPLGFVMFAFPWSEPKGPLHGFDGPDEWQRRFLIDVGHEVTDRAFDGVHGVDPILFATSSGHGIGKSALTAMLILWIMSTRAHAKGVVTANTGEQLKTKTMAELAKWAGMCITSKWFEVTTMSIAHRAWPKTWRCDAQTSREENSEGFAGLHNATSTPFYIFDEASAIPESIWTVAKGGLTDGEPMHFAFGNPTRNSGSFYECFKRESHRWKHRSIDSRQAKMTNKRLIQQWVDDYGEDSDFVRVRVRGVFPKGGDMQFIPTDVVETAMNKGSGQYLGDDALILGIDMARGGDDNCMLQFRRGFDAKSEKVYKIKGEDSRDSMKVVSKLILVMDRHKPDVIFMDQGSMGGPVADRLRQLGYNVIDVGFGDNAADVKSYKSRTAEMGSRCRQWLLDGGALVNHTQLEIELTSRDFSHNDKHQLVLERKKDMKKRLGVSPDWADALYLTFAEPVPPRMSSREALDRHVSQRGASSNQYNPLDALDSDDYR